MASQRHHHPMLGLFFQVLSELTRALLIDALSGHVRRRIAGWLTRRGTRNCRRELFGAHRRNRERLFNKLLTEPDDDS